jgi:phthiocerol/phenolphthiocerol synthesis type-I polyketide synthase E
MAGIWSDLLGMERVEISNNFFELGGHSMLAAQVISRVRDAFHIELPLSRIFEKPTVAGLSELVCEAQKRGSEANLPALDLCLKNAAVPPCINVVKSQLG